MSKEEGTESKAPEKGKQAVRPGSVPSDVGNSLLLKNSDTGSFPGASRIYVADTPSCVLCSPQAFFWVGIGHSGSVPGPLPGCLSRPINLKFLRGQSHAFFSGVPAAPVTVRLTHQEAVGWESFIPGT